MLDIDCFHLVLAEITYHPSDVSAWEDLVFKTESDAYEFYKSYAQSLGFSIKKSNVYRTSKNIKSDIPHYLKMMCHKQGRKIQKETSNKRKDTRTGCPAKIQLKMDATKDGYVITKWDEHHNHPLIDGDKRHFLPLNRTISEQQKGVISNYSTSGISARATFDSMAWAAGGVEKLGFLRNDLKNHLYVVKANSLKHGEATALQAWFRQQAISRHGFYYDIQVDEDGAITSIFWADSIMRADYALFGDFVSFDTTYRTNKAYRPLGMSSAKFFSHVLQSIKY